jgi:hypothetical protein
MFRNWSRNLLRATTKARMQKQMKLMKRKVRLLSRKIAVLEAKINLLVQPVQEENLFEDTEVADGVFVYLQHVQRPHPNVTNMLIDPHWTVEHTKNLIRINEGYGDDVQLSLIADNGDVMQDDLPMAAYDILSDEIIQVDTRPLP